ncbi:arginine repressor [Glutamicibacter sp.]|jgi:arginine repressor|uniref:arginine repressor n=1 Tax=Glutamicibacter sp. TaxID=1931995 RepID=UPI000E928A0A|nr:arginine repressor [Glutamicibacter sp.]HAY44407.1 arginine repressor [Micrococcaceae bacterium]HJX78362.1 arginine repressor [Glutamicibacter sp.]
MSVQPSTKTARQARIRAFLGNNSVKSQAELLGLLKDDGLEVTQATLSRDLVEIGAVRIRDHLGQLIYAIRQEGGDRSPQTAITQEVLDARLAKICQEQLVTAEGSANIVVLRTPPGAANLLALAIDHSQIPAILGCIAGDDTIMVITRAADGASQVASRFLQLAEPR